MSPVRLVASLVFAASSASRTRDASVVAVPKVRDPIDSTGALVRDGHGPGQHQHERKQMENMERYQQRGGSTVAALTLTMRVRGGAAEAAARPARVATRHWHGQEATVQCQCV